MPIEYEPILHTPNIGRGWSPKRWAKYHRDAGLPPIKVKNPERYLNSKWSSHPVPEILMWK